MDKIDYENRLDIFIIRRKENKKVLFSNEYSEQEWHKIYNFYKNHKEYTIEVSLDESCCNECGLIKN